MTGRTRAITTAALAGLLLMTGLRGRGRQPGHEQQSRHRVAATWTGPTFTFGYSIQQPAGRLDGSRMTFGAPITRLETLTYRLNGGQGVIPNQQEGTNQ